MKRLREFFKNKEDRVRKATIIISVVVLLGQLFYMSKLEETSNHSKEIIKSFDALQVESSEKFISSIVREELRRKGGSVKQGWMLYTELNPDVDMLFKNEKGEVIYTDDKGIEIALDTECMTKDELVNGRYDIYDKKTHEIIAKNVKPKWNKANLDVALDILANHIRSYGPKGSLIAIDALTGEILVDGFASIDGYPNLEKTPEFYLDGIPSIMNIHKKKENKNPEGVKQAMKKVMSNSDTGYGDNLINLFNDSTDFGGEPGDFEKYPLGQYNRDFLEVVHIPDESLGVEGTNLQLKILFFANEKDIMNNFNGSIRKYEILKAETESVMNTALIYSINSVSLSIVMIILSVFIIQTLVFKQRKREKQCIEELKTCKK